MTDQKGRKPIVIKGVVALVLIVTLLVLPHFFAASIDGARAEKEIRLYLQVNVGHEMLKGMKESGAELPTEAEANRVAAAFNDAEALKFESVEIKSFILCPPLTEYRMFVVKAVTVDRGGAKQTRYYSMSARSKFFAHFWVNEQSSLMWALSI